MTPDPIYDPQRIERIVCGIRDCSPADAAKDVGLAIADFTAGRDYQLLNGDGVHTLPRVAFLVGAEVAG